MSNLGSKIYVGNLSYSVSEEQISEYFKQFGAIKHLSLIKDHATGRSKGFAFVEYDSHDNAQRAINEANGTDFSGRTMNVNMARNKTVRQPRYNNNNNNGNRSRDRY